MQSLMSTSYSVGLRSVIHLYVVLMLPPCAHGLMQPAGGAIGSDHLRECRKDAALIVGVSGKASITHCLVEAAGVFAGSDEMSSRCQIRSWLEVGIASGMVKAQRGLIAATGIASGVDGEHHYKYGDAVDPRVGDHDASAMRTR
jgi:hypothetical protein